MSLKEKYAMVYGCSPDDRTESLKSDLSVVLDRVFAEFPEKVGSSLKKTFLVAIVETLLPFSLCSFKQTSFMQRW